MLRCREGLKRMFHNWGTLTLQLGSKFSQQFCKNLSVIESQHLKHDFTFIAWINVVINANPECWASNGQIVEVDWKELQMEGNGKFLS